MRNRFAKKSNKQSVETKKERKTKYGQLVVVSALLASTLLFCYYLSPFPEVSSRLENSTEPTDNGYLATVQSQAVDTHNAARLTLPKVTNYTNSGEEKKRLLEEVEKAVEAYPVDPSILIIAALTYSELQQTEKAIEFLKKSIAADAKNPLAVTSLAEILMEVGKQEEAVTILEQAVSRGLVIEPLLSILGEAYSQSGRMEDAVKVLERAVAIPSPQPEQSKAPLRLAQALTQLGRFEEAEVYARNSFTQRPSDPTGYVALSNVLMRQNKREEALEIRKQMPKPDPNQTADDQKYELSFRGFASHHYAQLGSAYAAHGSFSFAEQFFIRSLQLTPDSAKTALLLADFLRGQGRMQDAIATYKRLVEIQPDNLMNYHNLASMAVSSRDLPLAENALRMALKADTSGMADLQLARFLLGTGNVEDVVLHAQNAVNRLGTVDAYLVLIDAFRANGDRASAFNAYLKAKAIAPNDPRLATFNP